MGDVLTPSAIWAAAGLFLLVCEFMVPGVFLMFFGIGALVSAFITWLCPALPSAWQWVVFAVVSLATLLVLRNRMKRVFTGRTTYSADAIDDDFTGRTAIARTPINPGDTGKIELRGTEWEAVSSEQIPAGAKVVVVSRDGLQLNVRKA